MSLEKALEENTAAVRELTEITKNLMALRADAIETVKSTAAPKATTTKAAAAKATEQPAATEQAPEAAAEDTSLVETAKSLVAKYTKGSERPEEVEARKGKIKFLLRHKALVKPEMAGETVKFSVSDVMADKLPQLIKNLEKLIADGDLTEPAPAAQAEEELLA